MRVPLWLVALILAGCRSNAGSLDLEYRNARDLLRSEQYVAALSKIEDGLQRAERDPDLHVRWRFRLLKAEVLLAKRQAPLALEVLNGDPPDGPDWTEYKGRTFLLRGFAAYLMAKYPLAQDLFVSATRLARQTGSISLSAEVELRQALLLVSQTQFDDAASVLRRVIGVASELHDTYLEATATGNLGYTLLTASKYDDAIVWFERAGKLHRELGASQSIARDSGNLGVCYLRLGDYESAQRHYEQAQAGFAKAGNNFEEQIWTGNIGTLLYEAGNYAGAAVAYRRALEIARSVQNDDWAARWASSLGAMTAESGDWDAAERYNNEARALEQRLRTSHFEAMELSTAGRIALGRGRFADAERLFLEAMSKPAEDPRIKLIAQTKLASLYQQTGEPRRAEAEFQAAVSSIDRLNSDLINEDYKFGYLASLIDFYRMYVAFLMANSEPQRALEVAESSRSHVLAQRSGRPEAVQPHTAAAYQKLARQANATLLEYWLSEDRSYLWVITPQRIRNYQLPPVKSIRSLVETYRSVIMAQRNPLEVAADTGRKLYETLLAPAAENLCPNCRVVIVPDQDLYSLNFESLPAGTDTSKFWIEQANVTIAPSLDYLVDASRRQHAEKGKGLLVMGDPAPSLAEFPKLEYASREIDSIGSSMSSSESKIVRGADARPASYGTAQPGHFGFIHFSAHATANTQSPLDSAVILSGPPEQCKLFARDVMSVPLTAELVTISACRSAGAKTYAGEGLVGFSWAFLRAGARNVIAGLWDVNDRSTAQLMSRLYTEIAQGSTPAVALRTAKLALIHGGGSYSKPFYWAPFQLYSGAL